jgi:NifU-like protein involved in Fe-S cluster formation
MSEADLVKLYSAEILQLAGSIPHLGRLVAPTGSAKLRAPLCGSTITADVVLHEGRVAEFAQDVRACALGQASAAILGREILGRSRDELQTAREALAGILAAEGPAPVPPFAGYEVLRAARDFKNRHASILLALDAAIAAIDASA